MVPARDGVRLATDVYVPGNAQGPVPVMLVRTPYDKTAAPWNYFNFVRRGYALVVQDVRGRSASEGDFLPCYHEVEDGDDTLNWLAGQEWSNGRVGMIGGSYLGYVQWCAAASEMCIRDSWNPSASCGAGKTSLCASSVKKQGIPSASFPSWSCLLYTSRCV